MSATQQPPNLDSAPPHRPTDEQIALAITRTANGPSGTTKDLSSYLERMHTLADRPVVLDAAIRAALGSPHCPHDVQQQRAEGLKARFPDHRTEIDRTLWLNRMFDPAVTCARSDDAVEDPVPEQVGPEMPDGSRRYALIEPIGSGANGCVYLAEDRLLSSEGAPARVAVKLLKNTRGELGNRALSEARRMRLVEHPNVVRVTDAGCTPDGRAYVVQEYVEGKNLGDWLGSRAGSGRTRAIVRIMAEVAEGVQAVHAAGLVHHDLKPQNILVGTDGSIKVADFGSSTWNGAGVGRASPGPGTLAFMAPELMRVLDAAPMPSSDVFSLGAMLHWALTARPVAGENSASAIAALADRSGEFPRLEERLRLAGMARDLRLVIQRAASVRFEARHPSALAFGRDLRAWLARKPIAWTKPGVPHRAALLLRRRPLALAAGLAIAASLGFAAFSAREAQIQSVSARESEHAAELERQKLETEIAWKQKAGRSLRRLLSSFGAAKQQGLAAEVLTSLWILEWSHGPLLLDDPDTLHEIWQSRITVLERRRETLMLEGGVDAVEARIIEPSLALWYLRDNRPADAHALLEGSLPAWESLCAENDPWLGQIRALHAIATLRLSTSNTPGRRAPEGVPDESAAEFLAGFIESSVTTTEQPILDLARETLRLRAR